VVRTSPSASSWHCHMQRHQHFPELHTSKPFRYGYYSNCNKASMLSSVQCRMLLRWQGRTLLCFQVVLEPPTSLGAYVRGMLQLVAHPTAAYVGFFTKVRAEPVLQRFCTGAQPPVQVSFTCLVLHTLLCCVPDCLSIVALHLPSHHRALSGSCSWLGWASCLPWLLCP
jgi:hypothetical protein